jgi:hypothetical protein
VEEAVFNVIQHLNGLRCTFLNCFVSAADDVSWARNLFLVPIKSDSMSVQDYESFIDITSDFTLKQQFDQVPLTEFRCSLLQEYSELSECAVLKLPPFPTTYLCGFGFSRHAATKTKHCSRLDVAPDMRIQLSSITPNFRRLVTRKNSTTLHAIDTRESEK